MKIKIRKKEITEVNRSTYNSNENNDKTDPFRRGVVSHAHALSHMQKRLEE